MSSIREQIDACRAGRNDHLQPEHAADLGELARQVAADASRARELAAAEQADLLLSAALQEATLPAGLNGRLLAALQAAEARQASPPQVTVPPSRFGGRRRALQVAAGLISTALAVALIVTLWPSAPPKPLSEETLARTTEAWLQEIGPAAEWRTDLARAPASLPLDRAIRGRAVRWRQLSSGAAAYELTRSGGARAVLFVTSSPAALRGFPYARLPVSGRWKVGAWTGASGCVYVLAVVEDGQRIEDFLHRAPLT